MKWPIYNISPKKMRFSNKEDGHIMIEYQIENKRRIEETLKDPKKLGSK